MAEIPVVRKPRNRAAPLVLLLLLLLVIAGAWYWWSSQPPVTQTGSLFSAPASLTLTATQVVALTEVG